MYGRFVDTETSDGDRARRARLVVAASWAVAICAVPLTLQLLWTEGTVTPTIAAFLAGIPVVLANPWLIRKGVRPQLLAMVLCVELFGFLTVMTWFNGGPEAASLHWLLSVPLVAAFLVGVRFAWVCGAVVVVEVVGFWAAREAGFEFPRALDDTQMRWWDMAGLASIGLFVAWFGSVFEASRQRAALRARRARETLEQTNEELARARMAAEAASDAKARFLRTISHELRTPLNGVLGGASLLDGPGLTPSQRTHLRMVQDSGQSMLRLVERMIRFAADDTGRQLVPIDLTELLSARVQAARSKLKSKPVEVRLHCELDEPWMGDPALIDQVVEILLDNAVAFTAEGSIEVRAVDRDDALVVSVQDTGTGLGPDVAERLFEAFEQGDNSTTREHEGAGLGLALAKRLVEFVGGSIEIGDAEPSGTLVSFTLPGA